MIIIIDRSLGKYSKVFRHILLIEIDVHESFWYHLRHVALSCSQIQFQLNNIHYLYILINLPISSAAFSKWPIITQKIRTRVNRIVQTKARISANWTINIFFLSCDFEVMKVQTNANFFNFIKLFPRQRLLKWVRSIWSTWTKIYILSDLKGVFTYTFYFLTKNLEEAVTSSTSRWCTAMSVLVFGTSQTHKLVKASPQNYISTICDKLFISLWKWFFKHFSNGIILIDTIRGDLLDFLVKRKVKHFKESYKKYS